MMERLTEVENGTAMVKGCGSKCKYGFEYCRTEDWENCKTIDDVIDKLAEYEDLEEQGRLIKLPCNISCDKCVQESEQLAEWLEELKEMRKNQGQVADFLYQEGISRASKLIFNEIEEIKNRYDNEDFAIIGILIKIQEIVLETAEQLKAGEIE